jgi:molecular chaperone HtpG
MSPVIEKLASRGYDVLFATEPLDEIMMENLRNYKEKDIVDAAKENLQLDDDEDEETKKKKANLQSEYKEVATYLETLLMGKVQKVVISDLLTDSPSALVQGAYGMSPTMQKYMRAQSVASGGGEMAGMNKAVLEVNPNHPIVQGLARMIESDRESVELEERALLMYDVAAMTSGYEVTDMKDFAKRVMSLMNNAEGSVADADVVSKTEAADETGADVVSEAETADDDSTAVESEIVSE